MFQKVVTSVQPNGTVTTEKLEKVEPEDVERAIAEERRRISNIARSARSGRIQSIEDAVATIVVIYTHGAVKIYHWVPGA